MYLLKKIKKQVEEGYSRLKIRALTNHYLTSFKHTLRESMAVTLNEKF